MAEKIKVDFYNDFNTLQETMDCQCEGCSYELDTKIGEIIKEKKYCYALVLKQSGEIIYLKHKKFLPQASLYDENKR